MICGVDEAGSGPVMGGMVVAAISVENAKLIENLGFKDSKLLSSQRRLELFNLIKQNYSYEIEIINVEKIDEYRMKNQLNLLNRKAFEKVISRLNPKVVYVDAADVNEERFGREIKVNLTNPSDTDVISMHKADSMIPVVAAASKIAKQTRELEIKKLKKEIGDFGSGYPSDERTIKFLKSYFHDNSRWPPGTRKSWKTIERIRPVVKLSDFGD